MVSQISLSKAQTIFINFDTDSGGNPIAAPALFNQTTALTNLYASLGVSFAGPGGNNGGAVINESGEFGVSALSGTNFLAFNPLAPSYGDLENGGMPEGPETITFKTLATKVSIFVAGGESIKTFLLQGYNASGVLVDTDLVSTENFSELEVTSASGMQSVLLSETSPLISATSGYVFDNLSITDIPEPDTMSYMLLGFILCALSPVASKSKLI